MRHVIGAVGSVSVGFALGCGGFFEPGVEAVPYWMTYQADEQVWLGGGTVDGLTLGSPVTFVGSPIPGTEDRVVRGSAVVSMAEPNRSELTVQKLPPELDISGLTARAWVPDDALSLSAIPDWLPPEEEAAVVVMSRPTQTRALTKKAEPPARATVSAPTLPSYAGPLPTKLQHAKEDKRVDSLVEYEGDPQATAMIIHMMVNDSSFVVRHKAWRMIRARWKRGVGNRADHEAAARWLSKNGTNSQRVEADEAIAKYGQ